VQLGKTERNQRVMCDDIKSIWRSHFSLCNIGIWKKDFSI